VLKMGVFGFWGKLVGLSGREESRPYIRVVGRDGILAVRDPFAPNLEYILEDQRLALADGGLMMAQTRGWWERGGASRGVKESEPE
jgi:hypothetical protein